MIANPTETSSLGEVVEFLDSQRRPVKAADRNPGPYPYFGANGQQGTIDGFIFDEPLVLLAEDGGHFFEPNRGIAYKITGKTWVNNHAHVLRPKPGLDIDYLCLVLKHLDVTPQLTGTTRAKLTKAGASRIQIPRLPLAEQKRIAGILDAADALRAKRCESLAQLDPLLQSTFIDMFGDPVTNSMGWERKPLGQITSIDAPMVDPTDKQYRDLLHYGPDRIEKVTGELLPALTAKEDDLISAKFLCTPGEILYSKIRPYLNKVALVKQRCLCSADVYPVTASPEFLNKEYLWVLLRSRAFLDYVAGFSRRANIPKLNRKQFAGYSAPVPPLELQIHFAAIVESVEQQKASQRAHLAELDTLFASLQSRAFQGDL